MVGVEERYPMGSVGKCAEERVDLPALTPFTLAESGGDFGSVPGEYLASIARG